MYILFFYLRLFFYICIMKIFRVKIDNDPGGWKQGEDQTILVVADNETDAIEKIQHGGWGEKYDYKAMIFSNKDVYKPYISSDAIFSAYEVQFEGYEIVIGLKDIRKKKLEKLNEL